MQLTRKSLEKIGHAGTPVPGKEIFGLPEKVLQFGTGVLLRALPDYFIDRANQQGLFNGRILVVKSTSLGDAESFQNQDGLYSLCVRGLESGQVMDQQIICSGISRVISAAGQWNDIIAAAANPQLQVVISNTTEVGLQLVRESIFQRPPLSFPAKLLAFLYERFKIFNGSPEAGMVIIPTELLTDNGKILKSILTELAAFNNLESYFLEWLDTNNRFCSSLVDRIVPGKPDPATRAKLENDWGYRDELMSVCEPYRLWAIEGDEKVREHLSFHLADRGVVIVPDIGRYRELKLRMLNATHTLCSGFAYLSGFKTVKSAMENEVFDRYIQKLMMQEIGNAIPFPLEKADILAFGNQVLDRFRNPFLQHQWLSITMQYSSKMAKRVVPVLIQYYKNFRQAPECISMGFACFLLFMRPVKKEMDKYFGIFENESYLIQDDRAAYFFSLWQKISLDEIVFTLLANTELWQTDLNQLEGFAIGVTKKLKGIIKSGSFPLLQTLK